MKRKISSILAIALLSCVALFPQVPDGQSNEPYTPGWMVRAGQRLLSNQQLLTTSSPAFTGLTLSGLTASTVVYSNASKAITSLANGGGLLLNNGTGTISWSQGPTLTGTLTALNLTADPTLSAEQLTNVAGWTPTTNWTYASSKWSHATGNATALTATGETAIVVGAKYEIIVTITTSTAGGGLVVALGGQAFDAITTGAPTQYTFNVTARTTTALTFSPTSGTWVGSIDSISVKRITNGQLTSEGITLNSGQLLAPNGNITYPSISFSRYPTTGIYYDTSISSPAMSFLFNSLEQARVQTGAFMVTNILHIGATDTRITRESAAVFQFGADAAAPIDQTLKACDGSGADKVGAMLTLAGGQSTGTGTGGSLKLQTAYVAGTGSTANTYYTRQFVDGKVHSINNNSATAMFSIACADGNAVGGYINYTVEVTDGTDFQVESGTFTFAATNKATETWVTDADKGTFSQAVSASTLTVTWAVDTATADTLKVTVNSNSGLTPTSTKVQFQIFLNSPKVITIL